MKVELGCGAVLAAVVLVAAVAFLVLVALGQLLHAALWPGGLTCAWKVRREGVRRFERTECEAGARPGVEDLGKGTHRSGRHSDVGGAHPRQRAAPRTTRSTASWTPLMFSPSPCSPTHPEHALHLQEGWWTADCAVCGYTVAALQHQDQAEREARRTPCPISTRPRSPDGVRGYRPTSG